MGRITYSFSDAAAVCEPKVGVFSEMAVAIVRLVDVTTSDVGL